MKNPISDETLQQLNSTQGITQAQEQGVIADTVDAAQKGIYDGVAGIGEMVGLDSLRDWGREHSQAQTDSMSQAGREAMQKTVVDYDEQGLRLGEAATDPRAVVMQIAHMLGMNADIIAGGALVRGGRVALTKLAGHTRKVLGQKIADPKLLNEAAEIATKARLNTLQGQSGDIDWRQLAGRTFDYGSATHGVAGGLNAIGVRDEVNAMDFDELARSPVYQAAVKNLYAAHPDASADDILTMARERLADTAANNVKANPKLLASNYLLGGLGAVALENMLRGVLPKGRAIAAEMATEGGQGAVEQVSVNEAIQDTADPTRTRSEGVVAAGLNEAILAGGTSATLAGVRKGYETLTGTAPATSSDENADTRKHTIQNDVYTESVNDEIAEGDASSVPDDVSQDAAWRQYFEERYSVKPHTYDRHTGEFHAHQRTRPPYLMAKSGQPFASVQSATIQARKLGLDDYTPQTVDGGVVMARPVPPAPEVPHLDVHSRQQLATWLQREVNERKQAGAYLHEQKANEAYQMIAQGEPVPRIEARIQEALSDPFKEALKKWTQGEETAAPARTPTRPSAPMPTPDHLKWVEANEQAQAQAVRDENFAHYEAGQPQPDVTGDTARAELQKQVQDARPRARRAIGKLFKPSVKQIATQIRRKHHALEAFFKARGITAMTGKKLKNTIATYTKAFKDTPGYQPNQVFAEALANVKSVKKAIEKAPDPEQEALAVNQALIDMASYAERELTDGQEADDFNVYDTAQNLSTETVDNPVSNEAHQGVDAPATQGHLLTPLQHTVQTQAHTAATSPHNDLPDPTPAQIDAGNYKKGHVTLAGVDIAIENPQGSVRRGVDDDGTMWETTLAHHYGDIKGTKGADGDPVDVFIGPHPDSDKVYVVNQNNPATGEFDEHKVMTGFTSQAEAQQGYLDSYEPGWQGLGDIVETTPDRLRTWLNEGEMTAPFAVPQSTPPTLLQENQHGYEPDAPPSGGLSSESGLEPQPIESISRTGRAAAASVTSPADVPAQGNDGATNAGRGERRPQDDDSRPGGAEPGADTVSHSVEEPRPPARLTIEENTPKSIIVKGDKAAYQDVMRALPFSAAWDQKKGGWVFSKKRQDAVEALVNELNSESPTDDNHTVSDDRSQLDSPGQPRDVDADAKKRGAGRDDAGLSRPSESDAQPRPRDRKKTTQTGELRRASTDRATGSQRGNRARNERDIPRNLRPRNNNFRLTDQAQLGRGSAKARTRQNLDAIALLNTLHQDNRPATPEEQAVLAKYSGWGDSAIANKLFDDNATGEWKTWQHELKRALSDKDYETAARSTQYAFYTPTTLIDGMYRALTGFGFAGGAILDGGSGTGHFAGMAPPDVPITYQGIEMDGVSAQIAQALYPGFGMRHADFVATKLPQNYYDAVIGNPPFADINITSDPKYANLKPKIHDYFILKQLDALRPGGVGAFVTSKGTLDKVDSSIRQAIHDRGIELLGAIRMPQTAFKEHAGTEVVTDILFFRKLDEAAEQPRAGHDFLETTEMSVDGETYAINQYFMDNPSMVIGEHAMTSGRFGPTYTVTPPSDVDGAFNQAIKRLPKDVMDSAPTAQALAEKAFDVELGPGRKEDAFYLGSEGELRSVVDGVGQLTPTRAKNGNGLTKKEVDIVRDYIPLRDAVLDTYREMMNDGKWKAAQKAMGKAYDAFVANHGPINTEIVREQRRGDNIISITQYPNLRPLELDPDAFRVAALEEFDEAKGQWVKAPIFREKTVAREATRHIVSASDALNVSLNERGHVDVDYMAELYGESVDDILSELDTALYRDPVDGSFQTFDEYLSGNVKAKLRIAKEAADKDKQYQRNVEALERVIPDDLPLGVIPAQLGAHWVPADLITRYAKENLQFDGTLSSTIKGDSSFWSVAGTTQSATYATARRSADKILEAALNRKTIVVKDVVYENGKEKSITNADETAAANQKVEELREHFAAWVKEDMDAANTVHEIYNRDFNTTVPRKYDGSHLTLPRLSKKYTLHPWQRNVVWRILQKGNTYMAHGVGAGKTLASSVAAIEGRRLGLMKKPAFAVLKSTLNQFSREFLDAYPDAKILVADEKQLDKKNRRRFLAKVASQDWDAVIFSHESFEQIGLSAATLERFMQREIDEYKAVLNGIDESEDRITHKAIQNKIEKLEDKLKAALAQDNKDAGITFEETGIDFVFVDEAHAKHKKIPFPTEQSNVKGVASDGSNKAQDLYYKSQYLNTIKPNRNLVLMSGTPVTNTLGEVFNIQRYLQSEVLRAKGISSFDSWSSTFALSSTELEMSAEGSYNPVTRLNRFTGLSGLMRDFLSVADIVTSEDLGQSSTLDRPNVAGGKMDMVAVESSAELRAYQQELGDRLAKIADRKGPPQKGEDIVPVVILDGELASIDLRLVGREQVGDSKLTRLVDEVFAEYTRTANNVYYQKQKAQKGKENVPGATQMIFTDVRKPKRSGFDVYAFIKQSLIDKGVKPEHIAFIQDYATSQKKRQLFKDMNTGRKRILIGGTQNLGTGVNAQQRLSAIHHLTAPYMPSEMEQRNGRGIRKGNKNAEVNIKGYATKGTVDAFKFQLLESKALMIDQLMRGDLSMQDVQDLGDTASQMAMAKAIASGNPLQLELAGLTSEVKKLEGLKRAHFSSRLINKQRLDEIRRTLTAYTRDYPMVAQHNAQDYQPTKGDAFNAKLGTRSFTERAKMGDYLTQLNVTEDWAVVGRVGGIDLYAREGDYLGKVELSLLPSRRMGQLFEVHIDATREGMSENPQGLIRQLENRAAKFATQGALQSELDDRLVEGEYQAQQLEHALNAPFSYEQDLKDKTARLSAVESALAAGLSEVNTQDKPPAMFSVPLSQKPAGGRVDKAVAERVIADLDRGMRNRGAGTVIVNNYLELSGEGIEAINENPELLEAPGFLHNDVAYINLQNIKDADGVATAYIHERFRHFGARQYLGQDFAKTMLALHDDLGRDVVLDRLKDLGVPTDEYLDYYKAQRSDNEKEISIGLADELLAFIEPDNTPLTFKKKLQAWITRLKLKLRKMGFTRVGKLNQKDVLGLVHGSVMHLRRKAYQPNAQGQKGKAKPAPMFKPKAILKAIDTARRQQRDEAPATFKQMFGDAASNTRKHWLGLIPRRYLEEFSDGLLPSISAYMRRAKQLDADRNELMKVPAQVVDVWRTYAGKQPKRAKMLASLMHATTQAGIDPSHGALSPLRDDVKFDPNNFMVKDELATGAVIDEAYVRRRTKEIKEIARSRSGENTAKFMERIEYLKNRLRQQKRREQAYPDILAAWQALDKEGQALYNQVRDAYKAQRKEYLAALEERVGDTIADKQERKAFLTQLRVMFETQEVEGPYFPLSRFGDYYAVIRDGEESVVEFARFETVQARRAWMTERQGTLAPGETIDSGKLEDNMGDNLKRVDPSYHAKVMATLKDNHAQAAVMDEINQIYLDMLPEMSMRKNFIHRKKTAGFNPDALRAFSHHMFHGAYQLGRLKHSHKMEKYLQDMGDEARLPHNEADKDRAMDIYVEMKKRHQWTMNPSSAPWTAKATSLGFAWYLGVTPAAALVNITQTPVVALPVLGARFGFMKAAKALLKASNEFVKGRGHVDAKLSGDELSAFRELERRGIIEKTLAHDLAGVSEGGLEYSSTLHNIMTKVSFLFHHAERFNREVTAMAAYRLAKDANMDSPLDVADALTLDSHFDYSNAERARFMQNDAAKVLLLFRQHSLNMTYRLARDTNNAFAGADAATRRIARRQLAGVLGMTSVFAGAAGMPLYSVVAGVLNTLFDDEDEPWDMNTELRLFLADTLGETAAHTIMHGPVDTLTGATVSSRVGLNNLWFRTPDTTLEGRGVVQYYAEQALGPLFGIALSAGTGLSLFQEGHTQRGVEAMLPKAIKDGLRAYRYTAEGVTNLRGDQLIDEISTLEKLYQAVGLTPVAVSEQYEQNRAIKTTERRIVKRRQLLLNQYALHYRMRSRDSLKQVNRRIINFNRSHPSMAITAKTKIHSLKTRARYSTRAHHGLSVDERLRHLLDDLAFIDH